MRSSFLRPQTPHSPSERRYSLSTQTQVSLRFSSRPFLPPATSNLRRLVSQSLCYPGPGCVPLTCCGGGRKYHPGQHSHVASTEQSTLHSDPDRRIYQGQKQDGRSQISREENFVSSLSTSGLFSHLAIRSRVPVAGGCWRESRLESWKQISRDVGRQQLV